MPALIVIDGGKGQLASGLAAVGPFRDLGVTVVSLAKRIEEIFVPGRPAPIVLPHDTPALQLAAARARRGAPLRDRVPPQPARQGDDAVAARRAAGRRAGAQAPAARPLRRRRSASSAASREELEAVPGLPGKTARDIYEYVHKVRY